MLINNQRYARIAGVNYDSEKLGTGPIVYGRTHMVSRQLRKLGQLARNQPIKLITSFSDACVTQEMADKLPKGIHWYANNVRCDHPRVTALPIGCKYEAIREQILISAMHQPRPVQRNLMYMCFTQQIPRTPNPRQGLYDIFNKPWITSEGGDKTNPVPFAEFYHGIQSHPYVLSPHGAGPDCHRHWEAMLLGSIPIVLVDKANELLDDMPALRVNSWDHVTEDLLIRSLPEMQDRQRHREKLFMPYWERVIRRVPCE